MTRQIAAALGVVLIALGFATRASLAERGGMPPAASALVSAHRPRPAAPPDAPGAVIQQYCLGCHDRGSAKGDLVLEDFDAAHPEKTADVAEKMIHKLRAGLMPPPGQPRPDAASVTAFVSSL
jgi:hypothetical protein